MDYLQTVSELYMNISSVSLPISEPYLTLVSLRQSILCGYDNNTFWRGLPDMPQSFGCEAFDWLRSIWSSCKRFHTCVVILDGASVVQILKSVGASTAQ